MRNPPHPSSGAPALCRPALLGLILTILCAVPVPAVGYTVYGYEDPLGMLHLSRTKLNDKYKPLYEGTIERPPRKAGAPAADQANRPDHDALVRLLREKQAIVEPEGPLTGFTNLPPASGLSPGGFKGTPASAWTPERLAAWAASRPYPHPQASRALMAVIQRHAMANKLDPVLVYCVIEQESGFSPTAVSPKGAEGIMQIMPETQRLLGLTSPFDADANIKAGVTYLRWMLRAFKETSLALAAYNAGPKNVEKYGGIPPFDETRDYVTRILARQAHILSLPNQGAPSSRSKGNTS